VAKGPNGATGVQGARLRSRWEAGHGHDRRAGCSGDKAGRSGVTGHIAGGLDGQSALHRLEAAGLLAGHDDLEAGRRIRRYTLTDAGRAALAEARRALRELADELLQ
jgi:hypothetical protein